MDSKYRDALSKELFRRRVKTSIWIILLVVFLLSGIVELYDLGSGTKNLEGVVIGRQQRSSKNAPVTTAFLVRLDDNEIASAWGADSFVFREGERAIITRTKTLLLKRKKYTFGKYISR